MYAILKKTDVILTLLISLHINMYKLNSKVINLRFFKEFCIEKYITAGL